MSDNKRQAGPFRRQLLTGACAGYEGSILWREGERPEQLFGGRRDWLQRQGRGGHLAVDDLCYAIYAAGVCSASHHRR